MDSSLSDKELVQRRARRANLQEERARQAEQRVADEKARVEGQSAKTARLRELREARDAAERDAAASAVADKPAKKRRQDR